MKNAKSWLANLLFIFPLMLLIALPTTSPLAAESKDEEIGNYRREGIDVVQRRLFRKTFRHEFTFDVGFIADNQFLFYELAQVRYTFHFRETLAFEATYGRAFSQNKSIINDLGSIPCPAPGLSDLDGDGTPDSDCGITLEAIESIKNMYFGNIIWSPIYGKFGIFSKKIYHFDLFLLAGAGLFQNKKADLINNTSSSVNQFGFNVGIGGKVFLNDWLAIRADFRNVTVRVGSPFNNITNNRIISIGVSGFLPTKPYD